MSLHVDRKKHWDTIYSTKEMDEVSWYQPNPAVSLEFIQSLNLPLDASIIDVGGGDSFLVDRLLELGYHNLTVLDISQAAIERVQRRLGQHSAAVKWIVADAATFVPDESYDLWHDRAAFHFLTEPAEINHYVEALSHHVRPGGAVIVGTFSENGPDKCSGLTIRKYSEQTLSETLSEYFDKIRCIVVDHHTPFNTTQSFIFCGFKKPDNPALGKS